MKLRYSVFLLLVLTVRFTFAQSSGVRGTVRSAANQPLPFASILVRDAKTGTMANEDGRYEIALPRGTYELQFQYLNHQTLVRKVEVGEGYATLDVALTEQAVNLAEVRVGAGSEDPALTIMRKAIAMARFHALEVARYSARTYVKGTFRITDIPFLLKGTLKKANLAVGTTYVLESINDVQFQRPNTVRERVVSIRSNLPPGAQPSINFARFNFYQPQLVGIVSPLSPKAFAYYSFRYEGFFEDRGVTVNKIRVIPRSKGQNVLDGTLNLIEGTWSIHSFTFNYVDDVGFRYVIRQVFAPFEDVWMPVNLETSLAASYLGAKGEGRYVTSVRNYDLTVDPKYHRPPVVIDERVDKETAAALRSTKISPQTAQAQKEVTRKQLKKLAEALEKEDRQERKTKQEDVAVVRDWQFEIDTLARKRPAEFWNEQRQVPLTALEVTGYARADSVYRVNEARIRRDSLKNLPHFKLQHLLTGHTYNYGRREELRGYPRSLTYDSPLTELLKFNFFNAVEGYVLRTRLNYEQRVGQTSRLIVEPRLRYAFGRQVLSGDVRASLGNTRRRLEVQGGRYVVQLNEAEPISEGINTFYTLLREENFLKLYEKTYAALRYTQKIGEPVTLSTTLEVARRSALENSVSRGWRDVTERSFTPNNPPNLELGPSTAFPTHDLVRWEVVLNFRPGAKAGIFNGRRYTIRGKAPLFVLRNQSGFGDVRFNHLSAAVSDEMKLLKGDFRYLVRGGTFYGEKPRYLVDFKHFNGNQTIFQGEGLDRFRTLDYYFFSTRNAYAQAHADYTFQQFLLTQVTALRLYGIRENLFLNTLFTQNTRVFELGYGFSGILKTLGLEVVTSWQRGPGTQRLNTPLALRVRTIF
jgi:hypothetical protein